MEKAPCIVIEGLNGCGKDTQLNLLKARLGDRAEIVSILRANPAVKAQWDAMEEHGFHQPYARALQYLSAQIEGWSQVVNPLRAAGKAVLVGRGPGSIWVFNLQAEAIHDEPGLLGAYEYLTQVAQPTATVLLDLPVEEAMRRSAQQSATDLLQRSSAETYERRRQLYLAEAKERGWIVIDASPSIEAVEAAVWKAVSHFFRE